MQISGIQKLTLLDFPGMLACVLFTRGCNFRCPYCHNASLVVPGRQTDRFGEEEVLEFLKKRFGILNGVVITGGEPLLYEDLPELIEKIRAIGYKIKLDTNGSLPDRLKKIAESGLVDYIAMDIKNSPELYSRTVGNQNLDIGAIAESKDFLISGDIPYEFRTTVVKGLHTEESVGDLAKWISGAKKYYLQQFKDSGDLVAGSGLEAFDKDGMNRLAGAARKYLPSVEVRGV